MKPRILFCLLLLQITSVAARPVKLFDSKGRSIFCVIVSTDEDSVTVRTPDGGQYQIPTTELHRRSRRLVENWKASTVSNRREPVKIKLMTYKENEQKTQGLSAITKRHQEGYIVTITNNTTLKLPELQIHYLLVKHAETVDGRYKEDGVLQVKKGVARIKPLGLRKSYSFRTASVPIQESRLIDGARFAGGGTRAIDDLEGIWMKVMSGNRVVYEYKRPSNLPQKWYEYHTKQAKTGQ